MENRRAGFECITGDVNCRHTASDDAVSLEDKDPGRVWSLGFGVLAEEMGYGGAPDTAADYTYGGPALKSWLW